MKTTFRIIALLEGVSYILLMTVGLYFKYQLEDPSYIRLLGMPHGILFILYILLALVLKYPKTWNKLIYTFNPLVLLPLFMSLFVNLKMDSQKVPKWRLKDIIIILLASLIPFGTFYVDWKYLRS